MSSWKDYVNDHSDMLGAREKLLLTQALEAVGILKAAHPGLSDEAAIEAAMRLVSETGLRRAIEHNTEAHYVSKEQKND